MLTPTVGTKIYLCAGSTDMRKGVSGLSILVQSRVIDQISTGALFVFRGKSGDKLKVLFWDGQGYCLYYKRFERGTFVWPKSVENTSLIITSAQLSMLLEGIDWRAPRWTDPPEYTG